jgi:hypothetical protein
MHCGKTFETRTWMTLALVAGLAGSALASDDCAQEARRAAADARLQLVQRLQPRFRALEEELATVRAELEAERANRDQEIRKAVADANLRIVNKVQPRYQALKEGKRVAEVELDRTRADLEAARREIDALRAELGLRGEAALPVETVPRAEATPEAGSPSLTEVTLSAGSTFYGIGKTLAKVGTTPFRAD